MARQEPTQRGVGQGKPPYPHTRPASGTDPLDTEPPGRARYDLGDVPISPPVLPSASSKAYGHGPYTGRSSPESTRFVLKPPATGPASEIFNTIPYLEQPVSAQPDPDAIAYRKYGAPSLLPMGVGIGAVILLIIGVLCVTASIPEPASAPDSFKRFRARGAVFSCDGPNGWSVIESTAKSATQTGDPDIARAVFTSGSAHVDIITNQFSDAVARAMAGPPASALVVARMKVESLNGKSKKDQVALYQDYRETPPVAVQTQMGEGRVTEWMARDRNVILGGLIHGFRACIAGQVRSAVVICQCREGDWMVLKRPFTRMINSLSERADGEKGSALGFSPVTEAPADTTQYMSSPNAAPADRTGTPYTEYPSAAAPTTGAPYAAAPDYGTSGTSAPPVTVYPNDGR